MAVGLGIGRLLGQKDSKETAAGLCTTGLALGLLDSFWYANRAEVACISGGQGEQAQLNPEDGYQP